MLLLAPLPVASLALIVSLAQPALANKFDGTYKGQVSGQVEIESTAAGVYHTEVDATVTGCIAAMTGAGRVIKNVLYIVDEYNGACQLKIVRTQRGIRVEEADACYQNHGARCSFSGEYIKAGAP